MTDDEPAVSEVLARARRAQSPSPGDAERVRHAIGAALAGGAGTGEATGTRAASRPAEWASPSAGWASRILLVGAIAGASAGVGYWAGHRAGLRAAEPRRLADSWSPARGTAVGTKLPVIAGAATADAIGTPTFAPVPLVPSHRDAARNIHHGAENQAPSPTESLAIEVRALRNAERALRDGNPGLALAFLQELDRQVPNGQLAEERDAAATTARCARGDRPFGVDMANEFALRHPASVYRARVEQACAPTDSPATGDSLPRRSE